MHGLLSPTLEALSPACVGRCLQSRPCPPGKENLPIARWSVITFASLARSGPFFPTFWRHYGDNGHFEGFVSNKKAARVPLNVLISQENIGAGEGIRTLDPNLGKVVLYP